MCGSFAHTELNNSQVLDNIDVEAMMERGVGFNPQDPRPFIKVALDDYFPQTLHNYPDCYAQWIVPGIKVSARDHLPK